MQPDMHDSRIRTMGGHSIRNNTVPTFCRKSCNTCMVDWYDKKKRQWVRTIFLIHRDQHLSRHILGGDRGRRLSIFPIFLLCSPIGNQWDTTNASFGGLLPPSASWCRPEPSISTWRVARKCRLSCAFRGLSTVAMACISEISQGKPMPQSRPHLEEIGAPKDVYYWVSL